jgi:rhodanese-related sulfurtransferase
MAIVTIQPDELKHLLSKGSIDLIDVRTPIEHRAVHVQGVRLHPLDRLDPDHVRQDRPAEAQGPTYILCKSGGRSKQAAEKLSAAGAEVVVVEGGTDACVAAGLAVNRGQAVMSLERQVRIAAGALVLIFTLLGVFVTPWLLIVPAFIGSGLVFAGITDTCGMGLMLARMPWNQVRQTSTSCPVDAQHAA